MPDQVSFGTDIRPLFTDEDVRAMRRMGLDLANYDQVRRNAQLILKRVADKSMPPDRPWPDERVALLRTWIDGGMVP